MVSFFCSSTPSYLLKTPLFSTFWVTWATLSVDENFPRAQGVLRGKPQVQLHGPLQGAPRVRRRRRRLLHPGRGAGGAAELLPGAVEARGAGARRGSGLLNSVVRWPRVSFSPFFVGVAPLKWSKPKKGFPFFFQGH